MSNAPVRTAVVTGGHSYDVIGFHELFRRLAGVDAVIQHLDDFCASPEAVRDRYETVVFYIMMMNGPSDDGHPWYAGKPRTVLEHLGTTEQGILVLHHALLAYPQWSTWSEIVGIDQRRFGYHHGQQVHVEVTGATHPITAGLAAWHMVDETYTMADAGPGSEILLTVDHPKSMRTIGWTRQHRDSRVFCFESGHDNETWVDESFREVLRRGIAWCARRM
jgi:uncharacterized protein